MKKETVQHAFEEEVFFSLRKQRNQWAIVAVGSMILAFVSLLTLVVILPLNETKPYVVLVDKSTGESDKVADVRPIGISEQEAVLQAELVSYISDRETYDKVDNASRIPDVMSRSIGQAAESLAKEWSGGSPSYPPTLYGDARVLVKIKTIVPDPNNKNTMQVRIVKQRSDGVERAYVIILTYEFKPQTGVSLSQIWSNPLGFSVLTYRVDVESLQSL
jgi:type IV secretion system protein VirB8